MAGTKILLALFSTLILSTISFGQITSGKITFERKTNLKKKFGNEPRFKDMINEKNKIKVDVFTLYFTEKGSAFIPVESDEDQGILRYMTNQNTVYQDLEKMQNSFIFDLWGQLVYAQDNMRKRDWKITESKRNIGKHVCRKAIWQKDDSTRIYAWFTVDIVPSIGPESFGGLPGAILGLATEDGGIIYFATKVEALEPEEKKMIFDPGKKEVLSLEELKQNLTERFAKEPWGERVVDGLFRWI